jgi:hypothetical protein
MVGARLGKKGGTKIKDSLQKLLKTHVEKMSAFGSEQKFVRRDKPAGSRG